MKLEHQAHASAKMNAIKQKIKNKKARKSKVRKSRK